MSLHTTLPLPEITQQMAETLPVLMEQAGVPGLSIVLIRQAQIAWSGAFGVKRAGSPDGVTKETLFQAASLSKPLFASAVLHLVEEGAISLDSPLTAYLSSPYVLDDPLLDRITARLVLCHLTGWPNWRPQGHPLRRLRPPGQDFGYSGEGYLYLQEAIEKVTGQRLESLMQESVFKPLGMLHSSYAWESSHDSGAATGHDRDGHTSPPLRGPTQKAQAAASLHTTSEDYARFVCAMLAPGTGKGHLTRQWRDEMLRPQVHLSKTLAWGLGWGLQQTEDGRAFWHWGDNPGFKSLTLTYGEARTGIVMMANGDGAVALWEPLVELCLGGTCPVFGWKSPQ
jgi:CubicO group peptidase (beta-lactamase class C family)